MLTAINVPDMSPADDGFTELETRHALRWARLSGLPANVFERKIKGFRLSRYRAAVQAVSLAAPGNFVVSHLPLMTAVVSHLLRLRRGRVPHLGFAFNFTALPTGKRHAYIRNTLRHVDQVAVFSEYERHHYARYFDVALERFAPVVWTQDAPCVQTEAGPTINRPYVCAIGGEGRDFALLMQVARKLGNSVRMVVIARTMSLVGLEVPSNVTVFTDIPASLVWRIAMDSCGVLVPLLARDTCCGVVTLVSSKLLGLPIAATYAYATDSYLDGRTAVLRCEPGDVQAFARLVRRLIDEREPLALAAQEAVLTEKKIHDRKLWADYLDDFIHRIVIA